MGRSRTGEEMGEESVMSGDILSVRGEEEGEEDSAEGRWRWRDRQGSDMRITGGIIIGMITLKYLHFKFSNYIQF